MTKPVALSVLLASSFALMACVPGKNVITSSVTPTPVASAQPTGGFNFADMASQIRGGQSYRCTFTDKTSGQAMNYSFKGQKVAIMMAGAGMPEGVKAMNMIGDGELMYIWDPATKKGMKMTVPKVTPSPVASGQPAAPAVQAQPTVPDLDDLQAWQKLQAQYTVSCLPGGVNDSEFVPPTDVEFQTLPTMMGTGAAGSYPAVPPAAGQGSVPGYPGMMAKPAN